MDLNGLKHINDTLGHAEGDRLIKGAAFCIKKCFADHGKVFRTGGDEFAAIITLDKAGLDTIIAGFRQEQAKWSAENKLDLSISLGCAAFIDHQDLSASELLRLADEEMYKDKNAITAKGAMTGAADNKIIEKRRSSGEMSST